MNEIRTAPHAITPTAVLDRRFPASPLMTNPTAGKSGISQIRSRKFIYSVQRSSHKKARPCEFCAFFWPYPCSPLHQIDFINVHCFFVLEHRDDDPETDGGFCCSHCDDKYSEHLTGHLLQSIGKRDQ